MKTILVCGLNPAWQKTLHFRTLTQGEVNRAYALEQTASGKGINFCRAAKTWQKATTLLLQFAGGLTGKQLIDVLAQQGLRHETEISEATTRTCSTIISDSPHSVTELIEPNEPLSPESVEKLYQKALARMEECDSLAICGTYPAGVTSSFYSGLIKKAVSLKKFVMLDSFMKVEDSLQLGVSLLKINQEELFKLTGKNDLIEAFAVCKSSFNIQNVAITAGPDAAYFFDGAGIWKLQTPRLSRVLNPIGAGDTCSAVTCSEIMAGTEPLKAFQAGLCAASASCMTPSAAEYDLDQALSFCEALPAPELITTL